MSAQGLDITIGNDWTVFDKTETVQFTHVTGYSVGPGGKKTEQSFTVSIAGALRRALTEHEVDTLAGANFQVGDIPWTAPASSFRDPSGAAFLPKEGDRFVDTAGVTHRVAVHEVATLGTRIRFFSRKP